MQSTHQRPWCVLSTQQLSCFIDPFCKILQACVIICYFSQVQQKFGRSQENWNKESYHGQHLYGCCFSVDLCILCPGILVWDLLAPLKRLFLALCVSVLSFRISVLSSTRFFWILINCFESVDQFGKN